MRVLKIIGIMAAALVVALAVTVGADVVATNRGTNQQQSALEPFYTLPDPLPAGKPGDLIRSEPMTDIAWNLTNAQAYRVLYRSVGPDGSARVSSGMIFVPTTPSATPRKVVTYAHGTAGFGEACAPSRSSTTPSEQPWVQTMLDNGWVVSATDYVGVGTSGDPYYLIGQSEAQDVVNSVRAARNFAGSNAGETYVVMGQSQGGHSAIWTGELSRVIAPELNLVGVAVTAPAAQLPSLLNLEWNLPLAWGIGPPVLVSWPKVYPNLSIADIATSKAQQDYQQIAYQCVSDALLQGELYSAMGELPFTKNPASAPGWSEAVAEQNPKPLPASLPVLISESITDGIVFPATVSLLAEQWCKAGSNLQVNWLGALATGTAADLRTHPNEPLVAWPTLINWMQERFDGKPAVSNCGITPPVKPAVLTP